MGREGERARKAERRDRECGMGDREHREIEHRQKL